MTKRDPEPRLLNQRQAAAYCGLCVSNFIKACPIEPVQLLDRIPRYDRFALDRWIDSFNKQFSESELSLVEVWDEWRSNPDSRN
jgi:hypothetical protein